MLNEMRGDTMLLKDFLLDVSQSDNKRKACAGSYEDFKQDYEKFKTQYEKFNDSASEKETKKECLYGKPYRT